MLTKGRITCREYRYASPNAPFPRHRIMCMTGNSCGRSMSTYGPLGKSVCPLATACCTDTSDEERHCRCKLKIAGCVVDRLTKT